MPRSSRNATLAALGCAVGFVLVLALAYSAGPLRTADARALASLSQYQDGTLGSLAELVTFFCEALPLIVIVGAGCIYAWRRGRIIEIAAALVVVGGANVSTQALKHLLAHERFQPFLPNPPDLTTFPSGHVTGATSMVVALAWLAVPRLRPRVLRFGALYVLLVCLSVLVLEWHFPSDALGAIFVTGTWSFAVLAAYEYVLRRWPRSGGGRSPSPRPPRAAVPAE